MNNVNDVNLFDFIDTVTEGSVPGKDVCRAARRRLEQILNEKKELREAILKFTRLVDSCNYNLTKIKGGNKDYWKQFFSSWNRLLEYAQRASSDLFLNVGD